MKIYLDMDGVLCDFVGATCKLYGKCPSTVKQWNFFEDWGFDQDRFWAGIDEWEAAFWANLEPYYWTDELIRLVESIDPNYRICTTPSRSHHSYSGKVQWLNKFVNKPHDRVIMVKDKSQLARPGRLLVDDNDATFELWQEEGGEAILWPQPWNNGEASPEVAMDYLEKLCRIRV